MYSYRTYVQAMVLYTAGAQVGLPLGGSPGSLSEAQGAVVELQDPIEDGPNGLPAAQVLPDCHRSTLFVTWRPRAVIYGM